MLDEEGYLGKYRILAEGEEGGENTWYAYLETAGANPWYNGQAYSDTLNKEAVERFLQVTHEKYKEWVGSDFGEAIPMVFTDEPQFARKHTLDLAEGKKDVTLPWTDDCEEGYLHKYGESLLEALPELFGNCRKGRFPGRDTGITIILRKGLQRHLPVLMGNGVKGMALCSQGI